MSCTGTRAASCWLWQKPNRASVARPREPRRRLADCDDFGQASGNCPSNAVGYAVRWSYGDTVLARSGHVCSCAVRHSRRDVEL